MEIGLFGNPNTGKTTLFNRLTGSYEYVGNWSGVTVEKKIGTVLSSDNHIVDLPGVYSLYPLSKDESVSVQFLFRDRCDYLINILDASQLKRSLHLTLQLLETGIPTVIGLNMIDVAKKQGKQIDEKKLIEKTKAYTVSLVARTGKGCDRLLHHIQHIENPNSTPFSLYYGKEVEEAILKIERLLPTTLSLSTRWIALQLLQENTAVQSELNRLNAMSKQLSTYIKHLLQNNNLATIITQKRRQWIEQVAQYVTIKDDSPGQQITTFFDTIATHRFFGIPLFLGILFIVFQSTFTWIGAPISDLLDKFLSGPLTDFISKGLSLMSASSFLESLVLDGIVTGVGGVLVFVPQIFILFFFLSLLEDSGYMARVAFLMDQLMERAGLNGKAFIPLIIGFGCNVPGIMAARTIEQPKERLLTILISPFMSCSARLSVYSLFVSVFFTAHQALIVLFLYVLGIVVALVVAKIMSTTLLKYEASYFFIELPNYQIPHFETLWKSTWDKGKGFVKKAGTFIFAGSVFIWLLTYCGPNGINVEMDDSFLAMIGGIFAPLLAPLGFATWQAGAALLTGFLAKEVVVSTMGIIYHTSSDDSLQSVLMTQFSIASALSFLVFILLYVPCLATVAVIKKETNSWKWTAFSVLYSLAIAYGVAYIVYIVASILF